MIHDEMIAILAAHRDGRRIQCRRLPHPLEKRMDAPPWTDYPSDEQGGAAPCDWGGVEYRIEPNLVCKTNIQVYGYPVYVEGGPENARRMEKEFRRREFPMVTDVEPFEDKSTREEFRLKPA